MQVVPCKKAAPLRALLSCIHHGFAYLLLKNLADGSTCFVLANMENVLTAVTCLKEGVHFLYLHKDLRGASFRKLERLRGFSPLLLGRWLSVWWPHLDIIWKVEAHPTDGRGTLNKNWGAKHWLVALLFLRNSDAFLGVGGGLHGKWEARSFLSTAAWTEW